MPIISGCWTWTRRGFGAKNFPVVLYTAQKFYQECFFRDPGQIYYCSGREDINVLRSITQGIFSIMKLANAASEVFYDSGLGDLVCKRKAPACGLLFYF